MGLVAVSLPDPTSQVPPLMKNNNQLLMQTYWVADDTTSSAAITKRKFQADFQVRDMEQDDLKTLSGKGFSFSTRRK